MPDVAAASQICHGVKYRICTLCLLLFPSPFSLFFSSLTIPGNARHPLTTASDSFPSPLFPLRPGTAGYEYRQLFFTLVEHISTTVGIERLARCSAPHYNSRICRGILDRSFASIGISPLPWRNEHPKGRQRLEEMRRRPSGSSKDKYIGGRRRSVNG